ncbi:MAG TPA: arginase family protein [Polyangia bacterium]|nr:arginase family protein [Polyangia bacterium]
MKSPTSDSERVSDLGRLLRPAGGGLYTVSTGRAEQLALQSELYGAADTAGVEARWREALAAVPRARVAILGIPSDCGAGLIRGAAYGPQGVRQAAMRLCPAFREIAAREGIVDVGDVFVIPHLLHDDMLSDSQRDAAREALYGADAEADLPVSPLSMAERVVDRLLALNADLRIFMLGGDHSVAWPVVAALARHAREPWAIVHPDAHTDLLPARLGVRYCFATWAYHANELLGRGGRLVQVGIRASGRDKAHWERTLGVRQFWADEVRARGTSVIDEILAHLRTIGVRRVYLSNDIDATDAAAAPATGAPAPDGLSVAFVRALIHRVGAEFPLLGADVVEVAPPLGAPEDARRTTEVGAWYMLDSLAAMVGVATLTP